MTEPTARRPAFSATEPRSTAFTSTPSSSPVPLSERRRRPRCERTMRPSAISARTTSPASGPGMAKARSPPKIMPRVFTPTMRPARSTSGPPELPGAMAASCWIQA
ncbi:MAG TPA: hypothetical protein DC063_09065 [Arenimonas sp.]|nr:hypothetical protein [Arenimonas sp.]